MPFPEDDPRELGRARALAHRAVQLATMAARANLPAVPDDSHSNLGWDADRGAFVAQQLEVDGVPVNVRVSIASGELEVDDGETRAAILILRDKSFEDALAGLDALLEMKGLIPASTVTLPYALPADVDAVDRVWEPDAADALATLAGWFDFADARLGAFARRNGKIRPGPSPVRCWPHHFDIATYVSLEAGDPKTARGVGVGMSPGDAAYAEPYFYVSPWPVPSTEGLAEAPKPGHWHSGPFVGLVATASDVKTLSDMPVGVNDWLDAGFAISREILGVERRKGGT